jgi:hypothetical protein
MTLADVPVDEAQHRRPCALDVRIAEVVANRDAPRDIGDFRAPLEDPRRKIFQARAQESIVAASAPPVP